jgi:thioredoxin 1
MMKPVLQDVKASLGNRVKIIAVDVEKNVKAAAAHRVTGVPTLVLYKNGRVVWRQSGVIPPSQLKAIIETNV